MNYRKKTGEKQGQSGAEQTGFAERRDTSNTRSYDNRQNNELERQT